LDNFTAQLVNRVEAWSASSVGGQVTLPVIVWMEKSVAVLEEIRMAAGDTSVIHA